MTNRQARITKGTLVSVGVIIPLASALWWLAGLNKDVQAQSKLIDKHEQLIEGIRSDINEIKLDTREIKTEIKRIRR